MKRYIDKTYDKPLEMVREVFPSAKKNSARGHEQHLRISRANYNEINAFFKKYNYDPMQSKQDRRFSTSYLTHMVYIEGIKTPVVFSSSEFKVSKKDSLIQKQLTPKKLNISGEYVDKKVFQNDVANALLSTDIFLNSEWIKKGYKQEDFLNLLNKCVDHALNYKESDIYPYTKQDIKLLKGNRNSIGKDFGEIICAANLLKNYGNVTLYSNESGPDFDLSYTNEYGVKKRVNNKSGNGSGQSFNGIINELNIVNIDDYQKGSLAEICLIMLKILTNKKIKGRNKLWDICSLLHTSLPEGHILKSVFNDISALFFDNKTINALNYQPLSSFGEYAVKVNSINIKNQLKNIGIPKGNGNNNDLEDFYSNNIYGKENAILFYLITIVSEYFDSQVLTSVMNHLIKTKIEVIHIIINENGISFHEPKEVAYKFHFWANYKNITNNLLGFKSVYVHP